MSDWILEVENLTKIYSKSEAGVKNVSFKVKKNQIHAFIGKNGAGKTTVIKCIVDAYQKFSGKILINNFLNKLPEAKKFIGYVPENSFFPRELNSYEFLYEFGLLSKMEPELVKKKIDYYFKFLKIENLAKLKPFNFSSGQKRKIMIVQSLIHDPELIIFDEPFSNLDPSARNEFRAIIKILQKQGKTIFLSSHNLYEIDTLIDSLTLIDKGKIYYSGQKTDSLYKMYQKYSQNSRESE
ncbi:ABC transporter ATP-binding protein [Mesomycoplasma hyopneumoniae]|uniref:ABC transporter ATP binding protein n=1 Tax=Mesomycoplasma hyopneumoniae (strain 232) TaxID=295358 RepID=Q600I8_MESH2|nr:ABC transporter ATP-binding protein [Mesomycoplasma hyopneumoniae]AAV27901.1 ABC transporter ATP binding protein [Mesomycoplasma hyopneumoniae 232]MXR11153.1 ABC transporter ATP-binding protein [Mesomycoplasma hyopneumoniae]MXR34070.1 ABC transporter ATP-binding protein [Mesomycoplasma hyopneumoniae]MXR64108.1 ABC transporter ATP-binding protein [Mesomycoplasma hyopneumoniae]OWG14056.1 multidrug ABC transporter ATP-binding protein [Mesomycoplasma hyopneumoniae]